MDEVDLCPRCAGSVPGDGDAIWHVAGKLYCSQDCAQAAAGARPAPMWPHQVRTS